jgi:hypothetical protein
MSKVATVAKSVGGGLSAVTLGYLLTLFVTRNEFKKVEDDIRFDVPKQSEYKTFKDTETHRIECLEADVKLLLQKVAALEAKKTAFEWSPYFNPSGVIVTNELLYPFLVNLRFAEN